MAWQDLTGGGEVGEVGARQDPDTDHPVCFTWHNISKTIRWRVFKSSDKELLGLGASNEACPKCFSSVVFEYWVHYCASFPLLLTTLTCVARLSVDCLEVRKVQFFTSFACSAFPKEKWTLEDAEHQPIMMSARALRGPYQWDSWLFQPSRPLNRCNETPGRKQNKIRFVPICWSFNKFGCSTGMKKWERWQWKWML